MSAKPTLGTYLRRGREQSGLSMEAVSAGSRIVPRLVEALETDRQDLLPAPVYVRGFIRAYCQQIGADTEEALRLYDEAGGAASAADRPPVGPGSPEGPARAPLGPRRRALGRGRGAGCGRVRSSRAPPPGCRRQSGERRRGHRREPSDADVDASDSGRPSRRGPRARPASSVSASDRAGRTRVRRRPKPADRVLVMRATDTTWVRVQPDGGPVTEETLSPGAVREWRSAGRFRVTLGNAGGVELELDGRALPALGSAGQVVKDATIPREFQP